MADTFISYAREDHDTADRLRRLLERSGWSVWLDSEAMRGGSSFRDEIEEQVRASRLVIVLWSRHSVGSEWVRAEAALAGKKLLPVRLEECHLPMPFG
ncbi:MAG: toll/interleukin-1 receptor domain-containing protein, partial [Thermoanaerobaculia bacterium]|nr:toll/interleukin-1 receptor domain-containing protein [Thermoanaerobaculia bacterium]